MFQKIDGKVDVKVELQLLGNGVPIWDATGNVLLPQVEEHLLVSTVKCSNEVLLWRRDHTEPLALGMPVLQYSNLLQFTQYFGHPICSMVSPWGKLSFLFQDKGQKNRAPEGFKHLRLRFLQTDPGCNIQPGHYEEQMKHLGSLKWMESGKAKDLRPKNSWAHKYPEVTLWTCWPTECNW